VTISDFAETVLWLIGPTVYLSKFWQIPRSSSQNSTTHRGKIVQLPRLTAAFRLCVN